MSNPTTPFGWQMPEPTDLVTDLPADFEVFGQAIATDLQYLLGGTTGQVLAKSSATDLDFDWVAPTAGDIEGVTAGVGISGGGTSGTVTVTNSMATAIDAKGDLIVGTGADAFSRLAVGATNGHVLTVDSAEATGLKYAAPSSGGWTLISTTSLVSLGSATLSLTSIPSTYKNLHVLVNDAFIATTDGEITFGQNSDAGSNYGGTWGAGGAGISDSVYSGKHKLTNNLQLDANPYPTFDCQISIFNYLSTESKMITSATQFARQSLGYTGALSESSCQIAAAITSVQLVSSGGNWNGGTVRLYGEA